jgi:hypothetical protein
MQHPRLNWQPSAPSGERCDAAHNTAGTLSLRWHVPGAPKGARRNPEGAMRDRLAVKLLAILGSVVVGLLVLLEPALADDQYDWGLNPALASEANILGEYQTLVEVHQAGDGVGPTWYRIGHVLEPCCPGTASVQWNDSHQYDTGDESGRGDQRLRPSSRSTKDRTASDPCGTALAPSSMCRAQIDTSS